MLTVRAQCSFNEPLLSGLRQLLTLRVLYGDFLKWVEDSAERVLENSRELGFNGGFRLSRHLCSVISIHESWRQDCPSFQGKRCISRFGYGTVPQSVKDWTTKRRTAAHVSPRDRLQVGNHTPTSGLLNTGKEREKEACARKTAWAYLCTTS